MWPGRVLGLAGPHLRPTGRAGPGFRPDPISCWDGVGCHSVSFYTRINAGPVISGLIMAILEKQVPYSQRYLPSIRVSRVRVTLTLTVRVSSVSVMVSVRNSVK